MPTIKYRELRIRKSRLAVIKTVNDIVVEYAAKGFRLTLRQLYYQFVARGYLPNSLKSYKYLGGAVNDGRIAGLIDWHAIEDRTRYLRTHQSWNDPSDIMRSAAASYARDWWDEQDERIEVWIEKDALVGVIEPMCDQWQIPYLSCRGYTSQSEMWGAAMRMRNRAIEGQGTRVLHFGDHDPSGIDMSRDIEDRIRLFMGDYEDRFVFTRVALNRDQVEQYAPPPNPAKMSDSRAMGYVDEHGNQSWELDALDPTVLAELIRDEVEDVVDIEQMDKIKRREATEQKLLTTASTRWTDVAKFLAKKKEA